MEYRQLGKAGVRVSVIGLGTNRFGSDVVPQREVSSMIDAAQDVGINLIDTADEYTGGRSEETLGEALKGRREKFVLATKFYSPVGEGTNDRGASRYHAMYAVEASLRRLQSDHIDLYYVHWWDENTPLEETLRALDDLIRVGKVRYLGASNFAAWQLARANLLAEVRGWTPFAAMQSHYNMLERSVEREVLPCCRALGVGFVPYFPLACGFLTGRYKRGQTAAPGSPPWHSRILQEYMTDASCDKIETLTAWAAARDRGMNELAEAWLLAHPELCSVISGATKVQQVLDNAKAADWTLTEEELGEINAILDGEHES